MERTILPDDLIQEMLKIDKKAVLTKSPTYKNSISSEKEELNKKPYYKKFGEIEEQEEKEDEKRKEWSLRIIFSMVNFLWKHTQNDEYKVIRMNKM